MSSSNRIAKHMSEIFANYKEMRDKSDEEEANKTRFWDIVLFSTYDDQQAQCLKSQLVLFQKNGKIPQCTHIEVIPDPVNVKLGSGGAVLHCIQVLETRLGSRRVQEAKILIIHSGGFSQRLPSYSAHGKLFAPMPVKDLVACPNGALMLDVKFALYLPLCDLLSPGVLVCGSDHIETYSLGDLITREQDLKSLRESNFVAFAHPSTIEIGKGHGVYVFKDTSRFADEVCSVQTASEVLQKPTEQCMRETGAVFSKDGRELVYSDSIFWMSSRLYEPLLRWYSQNTPLQKEMCAYLHILPCLGERNKEKWNQCVKQDVKDADYLTDMFRILRDSSLQIIVLNESSFTHFGTLEEYIGNFCYNKPFATEMNLHKFVPSIDERKLRMEDEHPNFEGVVVHGSKLGGNCVLRVPSNSHFILEWSKIDMNVAIGSDVILSNCDVEKTASTVSYKGNPRIFGKCLYNTVPMRKDPSSELFYVTFATPLAADIKHSCEDVSTLKYFDIPIPVVLKLLKISPPSRGGLYSLWTLKLFPRATTAAQSFWLTHNLVNRLLHHSSDEEMQTELKGEYAGERFSLADVIQMKDLEQLVKRMNTIME